MQFHISVLLTDIQECEPFVAAHLAYLRQHLEKGDFIAFGPFLETHGGWILAQSDSAESMKATLDEDPLARQNLARYDIRQTSFASFSPLFNN